MKKYQWLLVVSLVVLPFCLGITTYATSKVSQAGINFTGDGSIKVSVILQKKDKETNEVLSGAKFELRDETGKLVMINQIMTTNSKGEIHLTRLCPGRYTFVETKSPKGYELNQMPVPFEVGLKKTSAKVVVYNQKKVKSKKVVVNKQSVAQKQELGKTTPKNFPKTGTKLSFIWGVVGGIILGTAVYCVYREYNMR